MSWNDDYIFEKKTVPIKSQSNSWENEKIAQSFIDNDKKHLIPGMFIIIEKGIYVLIGWQCMSGYKSQDFSTIIVFDMNGREFRDKCNSCFETFRDSVNRLIQKVIIDNRDYLKQNPWPRGLWGDLQAKKQWPYDKFPDEDNVLLQDQSNVDINLGTYRSKL